MRIILSLLMLLSTISSSAALSNAHIRLVFERANTISPYIYFVHTDIYSGNTHKVEAMRRSETVSTLDFHIDYPIYDELIQGSNVTYPFYIEPGDSLVINIGRNGKITSYAHPNGEPVKCENLMKYDVSNIVMYDHMSFGTDRQECKFQEFGQRLQTKLDEALSLVNKTADRHNFTDIERNIALCNTQMQFGIWLFEYTHEIESEIDAAKRRHPDGWQMHPDQASELARIEDAANYAMARSFSIDNENVYLTSRYCPTFINTYQKSRYIKHGTDGYAAATRTDSLLMDSAIMSKDCALMGRDVPSIFAELIIARRHYAHDLALKNDGSIVLDEVKVEGLEGLFSRFATRELTQDEIYQRYWDPNKNKGGALSPITYFLNRSKRRGFNKAKEIVTEMDGDDKEREDLMKAYEEEMKARENR